MEIGHLDTRVELINIVRAKTASGGQARADNVEATVWASIKQASWSQQKRAEQTEQRVGLTITIRFNRDYAAGFGPEARVRWVDNHSGLTRKALIRTVIDPNGHGEWLELACDEGGST